MSDLEQILRTYEAQLVTRKKERVLVVAPDGRVLLQKDGGRAKIRFTHTETKFFSGNVITHNHPPERHAEYVDGRVVYFEVGYALSPRDLQLAVERDVTEVRCVTREVIDGVQHTTVHRVVRPTAGPGGGWPPPARVDNVLRATANDGRAAPAEQTNVPFSEFVTRAAYTAWVEAARLLGLSYERVVLA